MATEEAPTGLPKDNDKGAGSSATGADTPIQKQDVESSEITEEIPCEQHRRRQDLILEIPARTLEEKIEDFSRINMPPTLSPRRMNFSPCASPGFTTMNEFPGPSSSKNRSTIKSLLPKLSFKFRNTSSEIEKAAILALEGSPRVAPKRPLISRTLSLTKLITPRGKKTSSLPVTPVAQSNPGSVHGGNTSYPAISVEKGMQLPIHRSHSVPVLFKDGNTTVGGVFRIVPTTPRLAENVAATASMTSPPHDTGTVENEDGNEDIPEEGAVCRICLFELGEGADTLKMECSCKGELALAHQECAVKWFSIKGNRTCDVCKQEVQNLPVTLLRLQNGRALNLRRGQQAETSRYRVWQDVPVFVIISMLAYFCFLEQLLVSSEGSAAIAISLPFSCVLGILASMTATTMVGRKHVWLYATVQFSLVVLAGHLFYSLVHMQAVLAILLATFTGFGTVMCGATLPHEILKLRRRWLAQSNQRRGSQEAAPPDQSSATTHQAQPDSQHRGSNTGDSSQRLS